MNRATILVDTLLFATLLFAAQPVIASEAPSFEHHVSFEHHIRPLLKEHCFDCHGAHTELKGGLDLRLRRLMVQGGDSGPAIEPGQAESSLLLQRIRAGEMPPGEKKVPAEAIAIFAQWIATGAATAKDEPAEIGSGVGISDEEREYWAFQPVNRPPLPSFTGADRVRTPIDALVLAKMKSRGLGFSPDADRQTLIRRAYLDLTGLPPSHEEVADFVSDEDPAAFEKLVDRLLASQAYGERWARHWLDVAGYADSEGYTNSDSMRPWAYHYRDYVIRALNADKPWDQFIHEQLAGDEMLTPPYENLKPEQIDKLAATGFVRMAADGTGSGEDNETARNQTMADTVKIVSTALLGLSVGCAQCHDHRYDPIPQQDYYQLRAIFEPSLDWRNWRTPQQRLVSLYTDADRAKAAEVETEAQTIDSEKTAKQTKYLDDALEQELEKHPEEVREKLRVAYLARKAERSEEQSTLLKQYPSVNIRPGLLYQYNQAAADELKEYDKQIETIRSQKPLEKFLRVLNETEGAIPVTQIFYRGDHKQPQAAVSPAGLTITAAPGERMQIPDDDAALPSTGRRLAYARWLTSGQHPLVTRVVVNRVWMHHFGRGIVGTPGDFGMLGERPTHPKLLDWLADEFVFQGWSLKGLHKLIITSTVYRQSSETDMEKLAIDDANQLYWKWPVQRLDAEVVRDRILATSGSLRDEMYGPAIPIKADETGQVVVAGAGAQSRRSVYVQVKRTQPVAVLRVFDAPVMEVNCDRRTSSTVAAQSLLLMNSNFMLEQAKRFADRLRENVTEPLSPPTDVDLSRLESHVADGPQPNADLVPSQVVGAWRLAYSRSPQTEELRAALQFLADQLEYLGAEGSTTDPLGQAMTNLCQALLSSNECLYVD